MDQRPLDEFEATLRAEFEAHTRFLRFVLAWSIFMSSLAAGAIGFAAGLL